MDSAGAEVESGRIIRASRLGVSPRSLGLTNVVQFSVMIPQDLFEMLVCPACKQPLEHRQNPETLKCTQCHRVYRVEDNIPIMLIDKATIEP